MIVFFLPLYVISCTEEIDDFDLRTAEPKFVVEANLTPYQAEVFLSKTTSYLKPTETPYISGAIVTISDGKQDFLLEETEVGHYTIRHNFSLETMYSLSIKYDDQEFTSESYLTKPVLWDSSTIIISEFDEWITPDDTTQHLYEIGGFITDPASIPNYYMFDCYFDDTLRDRSVERDIHFDGTSLQFFTYIDLFSPQDTVYFCLRSIDKSVYDFYETLYNCNSSSTMSAAPDNPKTNIRGGALGRFCAYSLDSLMVIIPEINF